MEKTISTVAVIFLLIVIICIACISPSPKVENAEDKVLEVKKEVLNARSDINQANQDSDAEYQQFKTIQDNRIIAFEKSIAELQANFASNNNGRKAFIVTKLAALEQSKSDN